MKQYRSKSSGRRNWIYVQVIGKDFKLHTVKRRRPTLRKLGGRIDPLVPSIKTRRAKQRKKHFPYAKLPPKRHGRMSNHYVETPGVYTVVTLNKSSGTLTTTITQVVGVTDWLHNVQSTVGDHKRPNNQRFTHDLSVNYIGTVSVETASTYTTRSGVNYAIYQELPWSVPFPNSAVYNKGLSRLYDQLRGTIDVSIDLAESHKTKHMMRDTLRSMVNLATTFRKMRRSNPRDWGNLWLEYTYGWKPLANTIYDSAKQLMSPHPQGTRFLTLTSTASELSDAYTQRKTDPVFGVGVKQTDTVVKKDRVKFVCNFSLVQSRLDELAGFTSLNPVSIAWELTPYSFVVDWFVDIGGYLRDFENACLYGSNFVDGYVTETSKGTIVSVRAGGNTSGSGTITLVDLKGNLATMEKKRTVLGAIPFPRRPSFDPKLGASRLISGASLLGQMLNCLKHPTERKSFNAVDKAFDTWSHSIEELRGGLRRKR